MAGTIIFLRANSILPPPQHYTPKKKVLRVVLKPSFLIKLAEAFSLAAKDLGLGDYAKHNNHDYFD